MTRVTRIHNRQLRNRFEERLETMVNTTDVAYKRSLEYLLYGEHPKLAGEFARVMEDGFRRPEEYVSSYGDAAVPLSNSVGISDMARLRAAADAGGPTLLTTRLLVTKVFLARCAQEKLAKPSDKSGGNSDGVPTIRQKEYDGFSSVYRMVGTDGKQRQWFVFDPVREIAPRSRRDRAEIAPRSAAIRVTGLDSFTWRPTFILQLGDLL